MLANRAHCSALALLVALTIPATLTAQKMDRKAALAEYKLRYKKVDRKNVGELLALSRWAASVGLKGKVKVLYRKVLRIDPQNEVANKGMGLVRFENLWVTPEEKVKLEKEAAAEAALLAAEAEKLRKLQMLRLPSEAAAKKRVRLAIEANRKLSQETLASFAKATGAQKSKYSVATSDHVEVLANTTQSKVDKMVQVAEYVYRRVNWIAFGKEDGHSFDKTASKRHLFVFVDASIWAETALWIAASHPSDFGTGSARSLASDADATTSYYWDWPGLALHAFSTKDFMFSAVANGMGHHWLMFHARSATAERNIETHASVTQTGKHMLYWMLEGMGIWASLDAVGLNRYWRTDKAVESDKYGKRTLKSAAVTGALPQYREMARKLAKGEKAFPDDALHNFYQLTRLGLWKLNRNDLVMAWSFIDFLIRSDTDLWRALIADLSHSDSLRVSLIRIYGNDADRAQLQNLITRIQKDRPLDDLYGKVCMDLQNQWKSWVAENYKSLVVPEPPFTPVGK